MLRHRSFSIAALLIGLDHPTLRYADLVVARNDGSTELDWELMATTLDRSPIDHGAHHLVMDTIEGVRLEGGQVDLGDLVGEGAGDPQHPVIAEPQRDHGAPVDGERQHEAEVVVGVLADQVDAAGGDPGGRGGRGGGLVVGHPDTLGRTRDVVGGGA